VLLNMLVQRGSNKNLGIWHFCITYTALGSSL
jgi:hypothetical protein